MSFEELYMERIFNINKFKTFIYKKKCILFVVLEINFKVKKYTLFWIEYGD